jgi:hypothetical protein
MTGCHVTTLASFLGGRDSLARHTRQNVMLITFGGMLITFLGVDNFLERFDKLSCDLFGYVKKISYIVRVVREGE